MQLWLFRLLAALLAVTLFLKISSTWLFDSSLWLTRIDNGYELRGYQGYDQDEDDHFMYEPHVKTEVM